jgi:hypothetical protein
MVIYLTPDTLIAPESSFHATPSATVMDLFVIPRRAASILSIREGIAVRAIHHPKSWTFAFVWHGVAYRAMADPMLPGMPVVLTGIEGSDHWQTCKACRDGTWCTEGTGLIAAALEGGAM